MKTILSIARDQILLETRGAILRRSGHRVLSVRHVPEFIESARENHIDLIVLGHSLTSEERDEVYRRLPEIDCKCPIIELYASPVPPKSPAHFHLGVHERSFQADLLLLVQQVLANETN